MIQEKAENVTTEADIQCNEGNYMIPLNIVPKGMPPIQILARGDPCLASFYYTFYYNKIYFKIVNTIFSFI